MIAFYDTTTEDLIGTVKEVNGKLVADTEWLKTFENDDPDEFFDRFSDWSNGPIASLEIPDGEEAPNKYVWRGEEFSWTAEEIQNAQKRYL